MKTSGIHRRRLLLLGGIPLTLVLACSRSEPKADAHAKTPTTSVSPAATGAATPAVAPATALPAFRPGEQRVYQVRLHSSATVQGSPLTQFELTGQLLLQRVPSDEQKVALLAVVAQPHFDSKLPIDPSEFEPHAHQLTEPFCFSLGPGGKLLEHRYVDQPSSLVVGIRQLLASAFQALPLERASWLSDELDASGLYRVRYQRRDDDSYAREKLAYQPGSRNEGSLLPQVISSTGQTHFDGEGRLLRWASDEQLSGAQSGIAAIDAATSMSLQLQRDAPLPGPRLAGLAARLAQAKVYPADQPWALQPNGEQMDQARLAGRSLDELLGGLRAFLGKLDDPALTPSNDPAAQAERSAHANLFEGLVAFIRLYPARVESLTQRVLRQDALGPTLISALGSAGSNEAHSALERIVRTKSLDAQWRRSAAISLSRTPTPSAQSTAVLESLLEDPTLGTQAAYGLGTSVRRLRELGDEDGAEKLMGLLLQRLNEASDPLAQVTLLRAIANSGHEAAFPAVQPFLVAKNDQVRASALEAVRLIKLPEAERALISALGGDPVKKVRLAAVQSLAVRARTANLEAAVTRAALNDAAPHVRLAAVELLGQWLEDAPSLRAPLQQVATTDAEEQIRKRAQSLLGRRGAQ